jgi:hypothetical protein
MTREHEYDPHNPRETDRRARPPLILKWWPIIMSTLMASGMIAAFYFNSLQTQKDVALLKADHAEYETYANRTFIARSEMILQFQIRDGMISALRDQVRQNDERVTQQFSKIDGKLDSIAAQVSRLAERNGNGGSN